MTLIPIEKSRISGFFCAYYSNNDLPDFACYIRKKESTDIDMGKTLTLLGFLLFLLSSTAIGSDIDFEQLSSNAISDPLSTEQLLLSALSHQEKLSNTERAKTLALLAKVQLFLAKPQDSMRHAQQAVELSKQTNQADTLALARYVIASNLFNGHDHQMAIKYFNDSLIYFEQVKDMRMKANILIGLARSYSAMNDGQNSLNYYMDSLQLVLVEQKWNKLVGVYYGIAEPYLWIDDAIRHIRTNQAQFNQILQTQTTNANAPNKALALWQFLVALIIIVSAALIWVHFRGQHKIRELETKIEQQKQHIDTISVIGREVTSSLELNTVAEYVYSHIKELFNADVFSIGIYDENNELIDFPFTIEKGQALTEYQIHMDDTERLAVWCVRNQKEVVLSQISDSHKYVKTKQSAAMGNMMQSIVYIPLMVENNIVGCITVQREKVGSFSDFQLSMMQTIASYTAIAVDNALTHEALKQASNTDFLTKLRNRRSFVEKAEYQLDIMARGDAPLCFAITDIDNFKGFNDTYGHEGGDYVLTALAKIFTSIIRRQDIVARWGGEEFVFMLPNTQLENAQFLLDKIRATIAAQEFEYKGEVFNITLTFGVTQAVPNAGLTQLMNVADEALYSGKQQGKNVVIARPFELADHNTAS